MMIENIDKKFTLPLLCWFDKHGRKNLPWQHPRTAYRVWIAEIMLQQTQVQTVIPYFERFMATFPDIQHLGRATEDSVLAHWSGLGYYTRARNIYKTAKIICEKHHANFPHRLEDLINLPGIGASTAAAIASQAFNQRNAILDANVVRVLSRYFMVDGWHGTSAIKKRLWQLADICMATTRAVDYTQAIMDLGATCCTSKKPQCNLCPLQATCQTYSEDKVAQHPFKKIKKPRPEKYQQFLLLHSSDNDIYLEKNPSTGLWGGLWCLPMIDLEEDAIAYVQQRYNLTCLSKHKLLEMKHSFSHFHLHITAYRMKVAFETSQVREQSGEWFNVNDCSKVGLAKPVSQLIRMFCEAIDN